MPHVEVLFENALTGQPMQVPAAFHLALFRVGSDKKLQPINPVISDSMFRAEFYEKVYVAYFAIEAGFVLSLSKDKPCDVALLAPEGADATLKFTVYMWPLQPDDAEASLPKPRQEHLELPEAPGELKYTCAYCLNRYTTIGSPYYHNATWYNNCCTNPPCT